MAIHLTPTELARETGLERRDVIEKCMELGVPIFQGRIDKTLFMANLVRAGRDRLDAGQGRHRLTEGSRIGLLSTASRRNRWKPARSPPRRHRPGRRRSPTCCRSPPSATATARARATSATASGTTCPTSEVGRDRVGDRARADRPRHRARRARVAAVRHAPRVDLRATSRSRAPAPSSCRSTRPTRRSECEWVAGNSESVAIVCEDAEQVAKIVEVRENLPALRARRRHRPDGDLGDAISLDELRERGRGREEAELRAAPRGRHARRPVHDHLHLRHHRAAQGLRALAPQLPRRS